jgi:hypothetical protein
MFTVIFSSKFFMMSMVMRMRGFPRIILSMLSAAPMK